MPLRSVLESFKTVTSGLILHFPRENNSSMTSQLSLNVGILRTAICNNSKALIDT